MKTKLSALFSSTVLASMLAVAGLTTLSFAPAAALAQSAPAVRGLPDFAELAEANGPSVVNIRTVAKVSSRSGGGNLEGMDEEMQEFFAVSLVIVYRAYRAATHLRATMARKKSAKCRVAWAQALS